MIRRSLEHHVFGNKVLNEDEGRLFMETLLQADIIQAKGLSRNDVRATLVNICTMLERRGGYFGKRRRVAVLIEDKPMENGIPLK